MTIKQTASTIDQKRDVSSPTWCEYWWIVPVDCILFLCLASPPFFSSLALFNLFLVFASIPLSCPAICQEVSSGFLATRSGTGQGPTAPPQIPPPRVREPRGQGVNSARPAQGDPYLLAPSLGKTWPELRSGPAAEDVKINQPLLPQVRPRLLSSAFMSSLNEGYASSPKMIDLS